jgi:integrase
VHVVAARPGHADPSVTLRMYDHVISDQLIEVAAPDNARRSGPAS